MAKKKATKEATKKKKKFTSQNVCTFTNAAFEGNRKRVQKYISDGIDVNRSHHGSVALTDAILGGQLEIVKDLLDAGAKIDYAGGRKRGMPPLMYAVVGYHYEIVELLLQRGADINLGRWEDEDSYQTPLSRAAEGHPDMYWLLLDEGADINVKYEEDQRPVFTTLIASVSYYYLPDEYTSLPEEYMELLQRLVGYGADINAVEEATGQTSLMIAAVEGKNGMAESLLALGVDTTLRDLNGNTALELAIDNDSEEIVKLLQEYTAASAKEPVAESPQRQLRIAAEQGDVDRLQTLIADGIDINTLFTANETALMIAARHSNAEAVRALLKAGANCQLTCSNGASALHCVTDVDVARLLLDAGIDPSATDNHERTPLQAAIDAECHDVAAIINEYLEDGDPSYEAIVEMPTLAERAEFQEVLKLIETWTGHAPTPVDDAPGVFASNVDAEKVLAGPNPAAPQVNPFTGKHSKDEQAIETIVINHAEEIRQRGCQIVAVKAHVVPRWALLILPTADLTTPLLVMSTNTNGGASQPQLVRWFRELHEDYPFFISQCSFDFVRIRFLGELEDTEELAERIYDFAPGGGELDESDIEDCLDATKSWFFWWD